MRRAAVTFLAAAAVATGCGGSEAEPFAYDDEQALAIEAGPPRAKDGVVVREVTYASGADRVQAYLVVPSGVESRLPGVLHLHGAGGDRDEQLAVARRLVQRGAVALTITAPSQAKEPPAGLAPEAALRWQRDETVEDIVAARRALDLLAADERVDPDRLALVGWSMGGRQAAMVAGVDDRVRTTVLMSTGAVPVSEYVAAAPESFRDDVEEVLPGIDPLAYVGEVEGAVLVQAARSDSIVPQQALQSVVDALPDGATVEWYRTDHALDEAATRNRLEWLAEELGLD